MLANFLLLGLLINFTHRVIIPYDISHPISLEKKKFSSSHVALYILSDLNICPIFRSYLFSQKEYHVLVHMFLQPSVADPDPGSGAFLTPGSGTLDG
jgi:hypothetical protein